ncbi:AMP-binding protein [Mycolicibacterium goodii]|uniref:AMP-binding protein n=1 Tax=Mycolicibacterium goodii TaxID=134601 RepID=UPI00257F3F2C|nr:AMP-binding protein [Mycolicibacterium goodii]
MKQRPRSGSHVAASDPAHRDWWQDLAAEPFGWSIPDSFNIADACVDQHDPDALALIVDRGDEWDTYTFGKAAALTRRFATVLQEFGLAVGDRVAVMVPHNVEVLTAHLGAFRASMITLPLSVKFGADAVLHRLADSAARWWSTSTATGGSAPISVRYPICGPCWSSANSPTARSPTRRRVALTNTGTGNGVHRYRAHHTGHPGHHHLYLGHHGAARRAPCAAIRHCRRICPVSAPHSTAHRRPVMCSGRPADWAWIGGLFDVLFPALALGCPVVATADKFTPDRALQVMGRHRVAVSFIPPTALKQMRSVGVTRAAADDVRRRTLATGGESLGKTLQGRVIFGVAINEFYGQTEMNMTIGTSRSEWTSPTGSMGRPFPGFTVSLLDSDGAPVNPGAVGEICIAA